MNCRSTPPNLILIDKNIENESGGVNYLKRRSGIQSLIRVPSECLRRKNDQQRPTAFTPGLEHILDNLIRLFSVKIRLESVVNLFLNGTPPTLEDRRKDTHSTIHLVKISASECLHPYLIGCNRGIRSLIIGM